MTMTCALAIAKKHWQYSVFQDMAGNVYFEVKEVPRSLKELFVFRDIDCARRWNQGASLKLMEEYVALTPLVLLPGKIDDLFLR